MPTAPFWRRIPKPRWPTVFVLVVALWSWPRLWPHVKALAGVRMQNAARPTFTVQTLQGRQLTLDSLRGHVVLVNVWATWCLPCRAEMPLLQNTYERHRDAGLIILGASVDRGNPNDVRTFVSARGITYPIAIVGTDVIAALGYPTSVLIGRDGTVLHKVIGPIGPLTLEPAIRRALGDTNYGANISKSRP